MKVLISDCHIGTTMWQKSMLESLGCQVVVKSLSNHTHYFDKTYKKDNFFINLKQKSREEIKKEFDEKYNDVTHVLCSFPPCYVKVLEKVPEHIKIILNIGHRLHIHLSTCEYEDFNKTLIEYSKNRRFILGVMSEYDFQYVKYYTGLEVLKLYVSCLHLQLKKKYEPKNDIILIGPAHNTQTIIGFKDLSEINRLSSEYAIKFNKKPYSFDFIKRRYKEIEFEKLLEHPAILLFPYSAFSISMVELYQSNIPMFVPHKKNLAGKMNDVKLYPLYNKDKQGIKHFDSCHKSTIPSPNSFDFNDELYWLDFTYFNQTKNCIIYENVEDLFRLVYNTNFLDISRNMSIENNILFNCQKENWKNILNER